MPPAHRAQYHGAQWRPPSRSRPCLCGRARTTTTPAGQRAEEARLESGTPSALVGSTTRGEDASAARRQPHIAMLLASNSLKFAFALNVGFSIDPELSEKNDLLDSLFQYYMKGSAGGDYLKQDLETSRR